MEDDWKGESKIKNVKKENGEAKRLANVRFHELRRREGAPAYGHRTHQFFFRKPKKD